MDNAAGLLGPSLSHAFTPSTDNLSARPSPSPRYLSRIAVRTRDRIIIVPTDSIVRIDAEGNYVRLWTDRSWLHKDTLSGLHARLDPLDFLRVHRSHVVNMRAVRELLPRPHGEFRIRLVDGTELTSGRNYRESIRDAFGLD